VAVGEAGGDPNLALDVQVDEFVAFFHTPSLPDSLHDAFRVLGMTYHSPR
jgi:hypothetical protein